MGVVFVVVVLLLLLLLFIHWIVTYIILHGREQHELLSNKMTGQFPSELVLVTGLFVLISGINNAAITQGQITVIGADGSGDAVHLVMVMGQTGKVNERKALYGSVKSRESRVESMES